MYVWKPPIFTVWTVFCLFVFCLFSFAREGHKTISLDWLGFVFCGLLDTFALFFPDGYIRAAWADNPG